MNYDEVLLQVLDLLQREKRLSYRVLKRRFGLDDNDLEDLKEDLIYAKQLAVDEDGRVLVWTGASRRYHRLHPTGRCPRPASTYLYAPTPHRKDFGIPRRPRRRAQAGYHFVRRPQRPPS